MRTRLIFAIVSTILEEVAIVVIIVWGLPRMNINVPLWTLPILMLLWVAWSVYVFRKGTRALKREQIMGQPHMIGTRGKVVSELTPDGLVRIRGELWVAKTVEGNLEAGRDIKVVGQERLKLLVEDGQPKDEERKNT